MTDDIVWLHRPGRPALAVRPPAVGARADAPTIVFLPGYMSDMAGGKATAVRDWATAQGRACLLFDYAGCGRSEGRFADQTLADWRDDTLAVIDAHAPGAVLLVGSSMGGWLMLLVALAIVTRDGPGRVAGLVGIAAAPDFTEWGFTDTERAIILTEGRLLQDTPYGDQPYVTTRAFWDSGQANRLLHAPVALDCPVRLLQGQRDDDVPWDTALRLADRLCSADVQVTLVKDGDHRLSRPADIALLLRLVGDLAG